MKFVTIQHTCNPEGIKYDLAPDCIRGKWEIGVYTTLKGLNLVLFNPFRVVYTPCFHPGFYPGLFKLIRWKRILNDAE